MSDSVDSERRGTAGSDGPTVGADSVAVEAYESDGTVVLFDAENPLAWLEAGSAIPLHECT